MESSVVDNPRMKGGLLQRMKEEGVPKRQGQWYLLRIREYEEAKGYTPLDQHGAADVKAYLDVIGRKCTSHKNVCSVWGNWSCSGLSLKPLLTL